MKIYTKTGDTGETSLFAGGRVPKDAIRVDAYGTVDELNSWLGVVRSGTLPPLAEEWLARIQNQLFVLGADLATPMDSAPAWLTRIDEQPTLDLEQGIDTLDTMLEPLKAFILPGGAEPAAMLHVARTVCRRAERIVVTLSHAEPINPHILTYLNRLSDFLFTLARWVNTQAGEPETKWTAR
jgi:cob(I)alamin adenosyltransferase